MDSPSREAKIQRVKPCASTGVGERVSNQSLKSCSFRGKWDGEKFECHHEQVGPEKVSVQFCQKCPLAEVRGPGLLKMGQNLGKAIMKVGGEGLDLVDDLTYHGRLAVCVGNDTTPKCELYEGGRCLHVNCGCVLALKAKIATETCPMDKWPKQDKNGV